MMNLAADLEFNIAIDDHHDFIRGVNEILPALAGRVRP